MRTTAYLEQIGRRIHVHVLGNSINKARNLIFNKPEDAKDEFQKIIDKANGLGKEIIKDDESVVRIYDWNYIKVLNRIETRVETRKTKLKAKAKGA